MDPQIKSNFQHKITINAFAVEDFIDSVTELGW